MHCYNDIYLQVSFWKDYADMFSIHELIDDVNYACEYNEHVDDLICKYYDYNKEVSDEDIELIKWFYVLNNLDYFIEGI